MFRVCEVFVTKSIEKNSIAKPADYKPREVCRVAKDNKKRNV